MGILTIAQKHDTLFFIRKIKKFYAYHTPQKISLTLTAGGEKVHEKERNVHGNAEHYYRNNPRAY